MLILWIIIFAVALLVMVKGADWFIAGAERLGLSFGMTPFLVGATIVGVGTSLPELSSSLAGALKGVPELVAANVIGSNIANILLIVGLTSLLAGRLVVSKNLIDAELPLLAISTGLFLGMTTDGVITKGESVLLLMTYIVYLLYSIYHKEDADQADTVEPTPRPQLTKQDFILIILGLAGLIFGAKYLIEALVKISELMGVATGVLSITAVAIGTSLPELMVSARAAWQGKTDIALGNIMGSNVFNTLVVIGIPGLFGALPIDATTLAVGVPFLAVTTLLFIISGISRRVHAWEGAMFLIGYALFFAKLFSWF